MCAEQTGNCNADEYFFDDGTTSACVWLDTCATYTSLNANFLHTRFPGWNGGCDWQTQCTGGGGVVDTFPNVPTIRPADCGPCLSQQYTAGLPGEIVALRTVNRPFLLGFTGSFGRKPGGSGSCPDQNECLFNRMFSF